MTGAETPSFRLVITRPADGQDLARSLAGHAAELLSRPSFRAGIIGSAAIGALCARAGMRPVPALVLMMIAHTTAERLYEMAEDIHQAAVAQQEYQREPLNPDAPSPL